MFPQVGNSLVSSVFGLCAIFGGLLFIIQLILQGTNAFDTGDLLDGSESPHTGTHAHDADVSFQWLSLQGFTVFFTMFGLMGLTVIQQKNQEALALILATIAGIASVWVIQKLFQWMGKLQGKGNLEIEKAVGLTGRIYLTIPVNDQGQVELTIQNQLRILDAVSESSQPIQTGTTVQVVKVLNGKLLVVSPV